MKPVQILIDEESLAGLDADEEVMDEVCRALAIATACRTST